MARLRCCPPLTSCAPPAPPRPAGFDLDNGRLDVSVHPFTGGAHPTDVRMTTRFKKNDLTEGLTGAGRARAGAGTQLGFGAAPARPTLQAYRP
jgi:carboxypeptidase Taq